MEIKAKFSHLAYSCALVLFGSMQMANAAPLLTSHISNEVSPAPVANAWLEIDTQAFESNIATMNKLLDGKSKLCMVMKANAYGHSIDLLMPSVMKMNVPCVGITSNAEAALVRKHGYQGKITRLRAATDAEIINAHALNMEELFGNYDQAMRMSQWAKANNTVIHYSLALNAGAMDRNGLEMTSAEGKQQAVAMTKLSNLKLDGIMTHYAVEDQKFVREHLLKFNEQSTWLIKTAKLKRKDLTLHTANSFTTLNVPEARLDMVRAGSIMYGDGFPDHPEYKRMMAFKTQIAVVNNYLKDSTVGYDQTFTLTRDSKLANLPVGYSDGYRRNFSNKAYVLVRGQKAPVVGRVSMNTVMVDVTDIPGVKAGDEVVLYGTQGNAEVKTSDLEELTGNLLAEAYTPWSNSNPQVKKQVKLQDKAASRSDSADTKAVVNSN
ncbi:alanine racemase [Acinetobacter calcoaceticus]|uniref:Broad specificity amino-acid racemase n=1 Tax=Acinetobacter calcoaceticus TaxID=471 RepID=A0A4R1XZC2_ACICA|nr:alanine racemase [Acinetobacter calcoaceticus]